MSKIKRLEKSSGRGANAAPRNQRVYVYFTTPEYTRLGERVRSSGTELSAYMRTMALQGEILARLSEEDKVFFRELVGMSNQLYQLSELAKKDGLQSVCTQLQGFLLQLELPLKKINHA